MTAVTHALSKINTIPKEILKYAFGRNSRSFVNQDGIIEQNIIEKIIHGRLRDNIDVTGPTEMEILLQNRWKRRIDNGSFTVTIPIEETKGKRLMSIQSMTVSRITRSTVTSAAAHHRGFASNQNSFSAQSNKILSASAPMTVLSTSECEIIGKNIFLVQSSNLNIERLLMTGLFSTDDSFSNIIPQLYPRFAKVALLLAESYIYTECYLDLSRNALSAGKEFSEMKEIVSRYEASEEKFEEEMSRFKKALRVNDPLRKKKHLLLVSPR